MGDYEYYNRQTGKKETSLVTIGDNPFLFELKKKKKKKKKRSLF